MFCLFLSGRLGQVLLYLKIWSQWDNNWAATFSNIVAFWQVLTQTSLCSFLLSLETQNYVLSLAQHSLNIQVTSKGSDQTAHMPRLIWGFAGRTYLIVGNLMSRLNLVRKWSKFYSLNYSLYWPILFSFQNRLQESLKLFRGICNNRFFAKSCMVSTCIFTFRMCIVKLPWFFFFTYNVERFCQFYLKVWSVN